MKATNHSNEEQSVRRPLYQPAGSLRGETVAFATLGLLALGAIVIAVVSASIPARPGEDQFVKYFRSGQMSADLRTAKAVMHYLFEAETAVVTNERAPQRHLAMPSTNGAVGPKA
jgi:hypothetical protein